MMKELNIYIKEAFNAEEMFLVAVRSGQMTKEQVKSMLSDIDMKALRRLSGRLKKDYGDIYFAYEPAKDNFLLSSKKDDICDRIAEFVVKNIENK